MMFEAENAKDDDQNESSGNLSQEFENVLQDPISEAPASNAEPDDMQNFEQKSGNFAESKLDLSHKF
jgi:hypothetical protein